MSRDVEHAQLLARARRGLGPTPADQERVRRALQARLQVEAAAVDGAPPTSPQPTGVGTPSALRWLARGATGLALVAIGYGVGWRMGQRAGLRAVPPAPLVATAAPLPFLVVPEPIATKTRADSKTLAAPAAAKTPHRTPQRLRVGDGSIADELRVLRVVERALREGEAGLAVAQLRELDRTTPDGALIEERRAAAAMGRCMLGQVPFGVDEVAEFAERYPDSVYRARVAQSCAPRHSEEK